MAVNKKQTTEWASHPGEAGPPALWEKETLQSLALFALVSFALIAYVLLVVKKRTPKDKQA
jgi:hypothetical protein